MGRGKINKNNKDKQKRSRIFQNNNQHDENQFLETLKKQGLRLKVQLGDGNCLFRSIADQQYGDTNKHHELRVEVIKYMTENKEFFKCFMEDGKFYYLVNSIIFLLLIMMMIIIIIIR